MTCASVLGFTWQTMYLTGLARKYPVSQYTNLPMTGTAQKAAAVPGADVGKPVFDQGANCAWEALCVHPRYNTPAGKAWGDAFWNLYFSHHLISSNTTVL